MAALEVEGRIDRILFRSADGGWGTGVLVDNDQMDHKIVGGILAEVGDFVRIRGSEITHPKYGRQIKIQEIDTIRPKGAQGIVGYLARLPNVGLSRAAKIYDRWGDDVFNVIEHNPGALTDIPGITMKTAEAIHEFVAGEKVKRDLIVFLKQFGLTDNKIGKILECYGSKAKSVLKQNPYRMIEDIDGFGFKTVDQMAKAAGISRQDPKRITAGIIHVLNESETEGHVYLPMDVLVSKAVQLLMAPAPKVIETINRLVDSGNLIGEGENDQVSIWKPGAQWAEIRMMMAISEIIEGRGLFA